MRKWPARSPGNGFAPLTSGQQVNLAKILSTRDWTVNRSRANYRSAASVTLTVAMQGLLLHVVIAGGRTRNGTVASLLTLGLRSARRAQGAAQDFVEDMSETVSDKFRDVRASVEERIEATLDAVDDRKRRVTTAFQVGRAAARESRAELEQRIADTKAAYKDS